MRTVFIADAHLKGLDDPNQKSLVEFLDKLKADNLVVLGDLFDFWTGGNKVVLRNYRPVLDSLLRLAKRSTKIIYLEGNHDFDMGSFFTEDLKASVYTESADLTIDNKRFYLAHGDMVSMTTGYTVWRAFLRSPLFRFIAWLATPNGTWNIADRLSKNSRKKSRKHKRDGSAIDIRLKEFAGVKTSDGFDCVVFAHSHVAGVQSLGKGVYANPGSWLERNYLVYDGRQFRVERYKG